MSLPKFATKFGLIAGMIGLTPALHAGESISLSGQILGEVRNSNGVSQMGAAVSLYNRYDELVRRALSNQDGPVDARIDSRPGACIGQVVHPGSAAVPSGVLLCPAPGRATAAPRDGRVGEGA